MYQDYYQYLQWLHSYIQAQESRINLLEQTIKKLTEEMKNLSERQPIHVDRIEYKFDQLKVETLDGTLNIGLNPSDLSSSIEDFAVQNQALSTPASPKQQMQRTMNIEDEIYRYLETEMPSIVEETQKRLNIIPNEDYLAFIKQDILKQLPGRIEYHLRARSSKQPSSEQDHNVEKEIIEAIKQEIQNGVYLFMNNLPENMKGS
jgi:spore germination protein PC